MQTINNLPATVATPAAAPIAPEAASTVPATPAPAAEPAKPAKAKRVAKPATPKPEAAPVAAKPAASFADERAAAAKAVSDFYAGASLPFKAASASLSDINFSNGKKPSVRTASLVAAMLAYAGDNIKADGTFTRGGFRVPARLINPQAKPGETFAAMPESGALGNIIGRCVSHVSGPIGGKAARDGIFKLNFAACRAELQQLGDATAKPALAVLNRLAPVKPAKPAKAA